MNREAGTTLVLVTHDRAIAARCDRQLRIEAGRLAEDTALPLATTA
jgi:putative ABC transport system ATP-binding protein